MLNSTLKKESVTKLKQEISDYELAAKRVQNHAISLHNNRIIAVDVIKSVEEYVNTLTNTPKEFSQEFAQININTASFKVLSEITYDEKTMIKIAGGGSAAGVVAGVATAAMAPAAAMAIATTFGTASTGAAISGLYGAAATNAALAWLGGGALVAGGGGMAGGGALLALAGPIGWGIGAASLLAEGIFANKKNKDAAIKADKERIEINKDKRKLQATTLEISKLLNTTKELTTQLNQSILQFVINTKDIKSFLQFSQDLRDEIRAIINNTESLSQLFMKEIGNN